MIVPSLLPEKPRPGETSRAHPHLAAIDGLRAVSILAVLVYHLDPAWLPGGFIGVDLFFVISGFVVSLALQATNFTGLRPLLVGFYARRAARILPALFLCLVVTAFLSMLFIPQSWLSGVSEQSGLAATLGYSNIVLASGSNNYFAPRAEFNIYLHTWSLGVEEQFYLIFPWLFLPAVTGRRRASMALFAIGLVASIAIAIYAEKTDPTAGFYLLPSRFWELALGALAFQISDWAPSLLSRFWSELLSIACTCIIALSIATAAPSRTPYPASLLPCSATAILLMLIQTGGMSRHLSDGLSAKPAVAIGRISYALYLWHWPVFVLFRWTVGLHGLLPDAAAVALASCAAAFSYRYVETPPRKALANRQISPRVALLAAACLVAAVHVSMRGIPLLQPSLSLSTVSQHAADWYPDRDSGAVSASGCRLRVDFDQALAIPPLLMKRTACPASAQAPGALYVIGDSHAGAYNIFLQRYVLRTGAPGRLYYQGGCAVLGPNPETTTLCRDFVAAAIADIERRVKHGDVVFLPGLRIARITEQALPFGLPAAQARMTDRVHSDWRSRDVSRTAPALAGLVARGAVVVLEAPKPVFPAPAFRCADWFDRMNPVCAGGSTISRTVIEQLRAPVMDEFRALVSKLPGVTIWDPLPLLCPGERCSAYDGDKPLFFDGDHLSGYANRKLEPSFETFVSTRKPK